MKEQPETFVSRICQRNEFRVIQTLFKIALIMFGMLVLTSCASTDPSFPTLQLSQTIPGTALDDKSSTSVTEAAPTLSLASISPEQDPRPEPPPTPTTDTDTTGEVSLEVVAQNGGAVNTVALLETIAYIGQGPRLVVLDMSNYADPSLISKTDVLPGLVKNIIVVENDLYLTAGKTLMKFDISDPTAPTLVDQIRLPAPGTIVILDDFLLAAGRIDTTQSSVDETRYESYVLTMSLKGNLRLLDMITVPGAVTELSLNRTTLFYMDGTNGPVMGLDIQNLPDLGDYSSVLRDAHAHSIKVYGDVLLVGGYSELTAYNVGEPFSPELIWKREREPELGIVHAVAAYQDRLYTAGWRGAGEYMPSQLEISLDEPLPPLEYLDPVNGFDLLATEGYLYRLQGSLVIEDRQQGTQVGAYSPVTGGELVVGKGVLYVGTRQATSPLRFVQGQISSYTLPELELRQQRTLVALGEARGGTSTYLATLTFADGYLYLTGESQLRVLNADSLEVIGLWQPPTPSGRSDPSILNQQLGKRVSLPVVDGHAFAYDETSDDTTYSDSIIVVDVSDPAQPQLQATLPAVEEGARISDIAASEKWLAVSTTITGDDAKESDHLHLYNISGETPMLTSGTEVNAGGDFISDIQFMDDLILTGKRGGEELSSLSVFQLPDLDLIAVVTLAGVHEVAVMDTLAFITSNMDSRLLIIDFAEPTKPRILGEYDLPSVGAELAVFDEYVIASSEEIGTYVLHVDRSDPQ